MRKLKRILAMIVAMCMMLTVLPMGVLAVNITSRPENGNTEKQPFAPGTGGSTNFRIPGIVTLNDGTLIAACDARWNHAGDGAGLDTIVSVSKDNGENWTYTFANYLGDNGDVYNNLSTCFIDPGIGTDGTTAYLIADLWPAGIALNTSKYSPVAGKSGYDANGNLLLRDVANDTVAIGGYGYNTMAANASYDYYLDLQTLTLHKADGTAVEGYTVDAYFNIAGPGVNTNLFFSDSPYQPYPTDYLYLTTSTDGLNWSVPKLLNLKEENEQTLLVGPGNGTYDAASGRMIFTAYEHSSGYERACLIWRDTNGDWHRSEDATADTWSSEATSVVLDDGTVRVFYRDGYTTLRYTDYVFDESVNNYVVSAREVNTAATVDAGCQLTSIRCSEKIDGKTVILVAAPTSSRRINGYIYAFLVDEDNSMELAYAYNVTPDFYAYSCLTELADGSIGLLYESAGSQITFVTYDFEEIANRENDPRLTFRKFELLTGDSKSFTDNSGYYGDADISELDTTVAELTMTGEEINTDAAQLGSNANYDGDVIELAECLYTFSVNEEGRWAAAAKDGTVYLYPGNTTSSGYPNREAAYSNLSITAGYEEGSFYIMSNDSDHATQNNSYLYFDRSGLRWDRVATFNNRVDWMTNCSVYIYKSVEGDGSAELPGYARVTSVDELTAGEYLIGAPGNDGGLYALYPSTSTANRYCQIAKYLGRTTVGRTELTFTGVGSGYTEVQVGSTVYQITVADISDVEVNLNVGTSVTVTEPNGNYADADTSELDESVATVTLAGSDGTTANGLSAAPVSELIDGTYVIVNTRARKTVTNAPASAAAAAGAGAGLSLSGTTGSFDAATAVWTITKVEGGYTVQDAAGNYMTVGSNTASTTTDAAVLTLNYNGATWTLAQNGAYLNDFGGGGTCAAGWQHSSAAGDVGSQFDIYAYSEQTYGPSTAVTFTGVYPGSTEVTIGRTHYIVTVTGATHEVELQTGETASFTVEGNQTGADLSGLDTAIATAEMTFVPGGYISNGTDYSAGFATLEECLYTFTAIEGGCYEVSATAADGTVVYLNHFSSGNNTPNVTIPGKIAVQTSAHENMFKLVAQVVSVGSGGARGLHFHSEAAMPYWNRCGNDSSAKCHEYLYRPVREGEESSAEIPGYVLVTDIAEIVDGGKYLIVHNDDAGALYLLHPTASDSNKWEHVAKLGDATQITFTGVGAGETSLTLPGHVFHITVTASSDHEHNYESVVTEPTCTEGGYTTHTCTICGDSYVTDETAALGHAEEIIAAAEPTFDGPGNTEGKRCSRCGEILVAPESIPALDYNEGIVPNDTLIATAGDWQTGYEATEGPANLVLDDDFATLWHTDWYGTSRENHWIQFELTDTYEVNGLRYKPRTDLNRQGEPQLNGAITNYDIQVSNDGVNFESILTGTWDANQNWKVAEFDAQNVKYIRLVAVDACTDNDYVFASAAEIRLVGVKSDEQPHEHSFGEWVVTTAPTCTEAGEETRACECGETETREIAALGHTAAEAVVENEVAATCTTDGSYDSVVYCSVCNAEISRETVTVPATGHTEEIIPGKDATCTETGLTEGKKCSVCNEILVAQEVVPALGHDWKGTGCTRCDATRENPFVDVPEDSFYIDPVLWAVENGITNGTDATHFDPNGQCMRAVVVTFLWRASGSPEPTNTNNPFTDVKESDFFYKAVLWAVEKGITNGTSATEFSPYALCNRAQVVTFLWRSQGSPASSAEVAFTDVVPGQFYATAVAWAVENGITNGISATEFGVGGICNRAQVVTFLHRTLAR